MYVCMYVVYNVKISFSLFCSTCMYVCIQVPIWPCFGRVGVSFVNKPYLDLSITPGGSKSIDLMNVPGISGWLSDTIDGLIDWYVSLCMNILYIHICMYISMYVSMYTSMYVYIYVCTVMC